MPVYIAECPVCGKRQDYFAHVSQRQDTPTCCGVSTEKIITPAMVHNDLPAYQSPIDGREVRGRRARMEDLKRHGCRPWEGLETEKKIAASWHESQDRKDDKFWESAVHEVVSNSDAKTQAIVKNGVPNDN